VDVATSLYGLGFPVTEAAPRDASCTSAGQAGRWSAAKSRRVRVTPGMSGVGSVIWGTPLRRAFTIAAVWRLVVAAAGALGDLYLPTGKFTHFSLVHRGAWPTNPLTLGLDAGVRNDALWYARIVLHGYSFSRVHESSIAFYPLYPSVVRVVSALGGNVYVGGMVTSLVFLFLAVPLLHAWLENRGLGGLTPVAVACLLLFPWSLFYASMYSESLYLVLVLGGFVWYERRQWYLSSLCVFLLAMCRPTGVLIVPALAVLCYRQVPRRWLSTLPIAAGLLGACSFAAFQWFVFGTPIASFDAAAVPPWLRGPHQALLDLSLHARPGFPSWYFAFMLSIAALLLAAVPTVYRRFGLSYALYATLTVLLPAFSGLTSVERYVVVDFPVFAALACTRRLRLLVGILVFEFYFLVFFSAAFAAGWAVF
jgi:hypothetical protein